MLLEPVKSDCLDVSNAPSKVIILVSFSCVTLVHCLRWLSAQILHTEHLQLQSFVNCVTPMELGWSELISFQDWADSKAVCLLAIPLRCHCVGQKHITLIAIKFPAGVRDVFPNLQLRLSSDGSHVGAAFQHRFSYLSHRDGLDTVVSPDQSWWYRPEQTRRINELGLIINFFPHLLTINITKAD